MKINICKQTNFHSFLWILALDGIPTKHRSLYTIRKNLAKNKARKFRLASLGGQWPYKKQQYIDDYGTKGIKEPSEDFEEEEFVGRYVSLFSTW